MSRDSVAPCLLRTPAPQNVGKAVLAGMRPNGSDYPTDMANLRTGCRIEAKRDAAIDYVQLAGQCAGGDGSWPTFQVRLPLFILLLFLLYCSGEHWPLQLPGIRLAASLHGLPMRHARPLLIAR